MEKKNFINMAVTCFQIPKESVYIFNVLQYFKTL